MPSPDTTWSVGQRATLNRERVVTIERVTAAGRAVVEGRIFEANGRERGGGNIYRRPKLEPLTTEIQAEMDLVAQGRRVFREADRLMEAAAKWLRAASSAWGRPVPEADDVERGEKLVAALRTVMGETDHAQS